jgi:hypothetical protein
LVLPDPEAIGNPRCRQIPERAQHSRTVANEKYAFSDDVDDAEVARVGEFVVATDCVPTCSQ